MNLALKACAQIMLLPLKLALQAFAIDNLLFIVLCQRRGFESNITMIREDNKMMKMTQKKKSDRQGLTIVDGYEDDIPLAEYNRPSVIDQIDQIDDSINTINVDTLDPLEQVEENLDNEIIPVIQEPGSLLNNAFSSLPLSQS